jgi:mitochondrial fission protein ELM1
MDAVKKVTEEPKVWVLVDNRIGNSNQAIVLAEEIGEPFTIKHIEYNHFGRLPSSMLSLFPLHVKRSILNTLKKEKIPDIIISAGRRSAALAVHLKKLSGDRSKIIQIMRPNIDPKEFELIILPQHDAYNYTLPNIVRIIGALTNVQARLPKVKVEFENKYPDIKNFIAVIIGGSTKNYKLTMENARELGESLTTIAESHSLALFITFSRRTPQNVRYYFQENFSWPNICYDPESGESNPYPAIIGKAEFIISTTDSISMCSEAASTGKPVYVYSPDNFTLKKHNFFIQQLVDLGIVRRLDKSIDYLETYNYNPLSEISKVAEIIRNNLL